jgi:hypothetical protein
MAGYDVAHERDFQYIQSCNAPTCRKNSLDRRRKEDCFAFLMLLRRWSGPVVVSLRTFRQNPEGQKSVEDNRAIAIVLML